MSTATVTLRAALLFATATSALAQTRLPNGAPGPDYWQQRADYSIDVALDGVNHRIRGRVTIRYHNNAPVALPFIYLQLDQNLFRVGGVYGFTLGEITQELNERRVPLAKPSEAPKTVARLNLAEPLATGAVATLHIDYTFLIPENGSDRMGRVGMDSGRIYAIAQWYPRVAVYDDVAGWNTEPYTGAGEFYLEYGDFDYAITLPYEYIVAATGTLENPADVLTAIQRDRLAIARASATTEAIITRSEAKSPDKRSAATPATKTWRFRAQNVRDIAWVASTLFAWDATSWNGVLVQSFYHHDGIGDWSNGATYLGRALSTYAQLWGPYPYPTATNVQGSAMANSMEYPMLAFQPLGLAAGLESSTYHEFAHQWFPMIVGSNERLHPWMDEGFATFMQGTHTQTAMATPQALAAYSAEQRAARRAVPITTAPEKLTPEQRSAAHFNTPAAGLALLRQHILGPAVFDTAFREYVRRWAYKHPRPDDFFRTMNDVTGQDLDWFWNGWFKTTERLDQAVDSVSVRENTAQIHLSSPGRLRFPVKVRVTYADGTRDDVLVPVTVWGNGSRGTYEHTLRGTIASVEIDPDAVFPDERRRNNAWRRAR